MPTQAKTKSQEGEREDTEMARQMATAEEARRYIAEGWGEEETAEWLASNEGEEEWAMADQICTWADAEEEEIPAHILAWARANR